MTVIKVTEKPKLKDPILVEGLPGVGNIGRVAVGYMVSELKTKKFAQLYSRHFFPFVMLHNDYEIRLLKNEFHYLKATKKGQRDIVFLTGDCQSLSPHGHYEVAGKMLDFVEGLGVREVITIGGLATGELEEAPKVLGSATDKQTMEKYKKFGIDFKAADRVGYIVGAAGLLPGLGMERGMKGLCVLGETSGFPIVTDPKSAESILRILIKALNLNLDMSKLDKRVKEMEGFIKKVEELQKKALMQIAKEEKAPVQGKEQLRYIG